MEIKEHVKETSGGETQIGVIIKKNKEPIAFHEVWGRVKEKRMIK